MTEIERLVIEAFNAAAATGKPTPDCYLAAAAAWHARFPDNVSSYARQAAVAIILRQRIKAWWRDHQREMYAGVPVERGRGSGVPKAPSSLGLDRSEPVADEEIWATE